MDNSRMETRSDQIRELKAEIKRLEMVLGTLIIYLQKDIGRNACETLLKQLDNE